MDSLEHLQAQLASNQIRIDQRATWNPALSGDIDIFIDRHGNWFHEGEPMLRRGLVKLFAGILRREVDGEYYLVTPIEKWRIRVDDLPFLAVAVHALSGESGYPRLVFETNLGDKVLADRQHPVIVETAGKQNNPLPRLELDQGLAARINRPTYYQLIEMALQQPGSQERGKLWLSSGEQRFCLGNLEAG